MSDYYNNLATRIEEAVQGLSGVKRIRATAAEGVASVSIELHSGEDVSRRMAEIRARVDAIESWPEEAERPTVAQAEFPRHVLSIAVSGVADERTLKILPQQAREELAALPEISEVSLASVRPGRNLLASLLKGTEAHHVPFLWLKGESPHGAGSDATWISIAQIANQGTLLMQLDGAHGAETLAGAAARAEFRINMNLSERADLNCLFRALCTVPLYAGLAHDRIVETLFFNFDHLDAAGAPPHFS